jgi:Na+-translocating ferredoxin:NAD+ oxidoreductase RNF subunit RnfB
MEYKHYFHAIDLIADHCVGCTHCVRVCPTEAIRVRDGKATIDEYRCIDCGRCIEACSYNAIRPISDHIEIIHNFRYKMAILSTAFAGQFPDDIPYEKVKKAVMGLGFDMVTDEAEATDDMSILIRRYIIEHPEIRPILSSDCPAVVRMIQVRYPSLLPNIVRNEAPMSILSTYYRQRVFRELDIPPNEIGIFVVVPCISQVTAVYQPEGAYKRFQDGAFSNKYMYNLVMARIQAMKSEEDSTRVRKFDPYNRMLTARPERTDYAGRLTRGHTWAISGMEAEHVGERVLKTLSVSGIKNVNRILAKIENQQTDNFDYVVLSSCIEGCVGGVLNPENPFVASSRIRRLIDETLPTDHLDKDWFYKLHEKGFFGILPLEPRSVMSLDTDIKQAIAKMKRVKEIVASLPGFNCSACGSPSCRALAEDIVRGQATPDDCLIRLRQNMVEKEDE